jgi:hypothetical protein
MNEERFVISIGEGKFAVVAGHKLNAEPLTRAEADRLAHEPVKPAAKLPPREAPPPPPKRKPAAQSAPQPAPAIDLRAERWTGRGGSAGFTIRGR